MHYDRNGEPISLWRYVELFDKPDYQRVAWTSVAEGIVVSTVWIGIDHSFGRRAPEIFETMVFYELEEPRVVFDRPCTQEEAGTWRWSTQEDALAGHERVVAELRSNFEVPVMDPTENQ